MDSTMQSRHLLRLLLCLASIVTTFETSRAFPEVKQAADYAKEPFLIEVAKVNIRFENDGTGKTQQNVRVRVQSESGVQQWGQLRFGYNSANERLEINYVRVMKPDGSVVTAGAEAVLELNEPTIRRVRGFGRSFRRLEGRGLTTSAAKSR